MQGSGHGRQLDAEAKDMCLYELSCYVFCLKDMVHAYEVGIARNYTQKHKACVYISFHVMLLRLAHCLTHINDNMEL